MQTSREFAQGSGGVVVASLLGAIICFTTTGALAEEPLKFPRGHLEPIKWSELAGWTADDHLAAFAAYQTSCQARLKIRRRDERGELSAALSNVCRKAANLQPQDTETARAFFEQNFQPLRIGRLGEAKGLLTGYFEPIVAGSRFPTAEFHVPLYRRPRDLVAAGYKPGSVAFPNKDVRIGRRNENNGLVPYHDRSAIEVGALDGQRLEICWLRDPFDLLAIQLEGSGRVILEDGTPLRVSVDSHNGYPYSSIERVLVDRNLIPRNAISPQGIRDWMAAHPDVAAKVRAANRSYVFFRVTGLTNEGEPVGAQGVPTDSTLPLPSCFPTSSTAIFVFGRGDGLCRPVALAPALAGLALPLSPCFLTSSATMLGFRGRNGISPLAARVPTDSTLPLPSCFPTSNGAISGFCTGNGASRPAAAISSSRGSSITKRAGWRMRPAMRPASSPAPQ